VNAPAKLTRYQVTVVAILAFLRFTVVLDFMVLSPTFDRFVPSVMNFCSLKIIGPGLRLLSGTLPSPFSR